MRDVSPSPLSPQPNQFRQTTALIQFINEIKHKVIRAPLSLFCHGTFLSIRTSWQTDEVFIDLAWERVLVKVSLHLLYLHDECEQNSWGASSNFPCQLLPQMNRERITYQASNQLNVFPKPSLLPVFTGLLSRIKSNVIGWWELDGCADRPMRCTDLSELMLDEAHLQPLHCFQAVVCYLCYNSAALFVCDSFQVNVTCPKSEVIPNNGWWSPSGGKLFTSCCVRHLMFVLTGCCKSVF